MYLSMSRPFQGAENKPHICVMAKALVYWLTVATHKKRGIKDEKVDAPPQEGMNFNLNVSSFGGKEMQ